MATLKIWTFKEQSKLKITICELTNWPKYGDIDQNFQKSLLLTLSHSIPFSKFFRSLGPKKAFEDCLSREKNPVGGR